MLLEQNAKSFDQISANHSALNVHDKFYLFCQTRDNIIALLNKLHSMPTWIMQHMPPPPAKLNMELANSILPPWNLESFISILKKKTIFFFQIHQSFFLCLQTSDPLRCFSL